MGLKQFLMPALSARLLSRDRLLRQRASAERQRRARGLPHEVHYFHQADDPYSALAAQALAPLAARYDITLRPQVVGPPPDDAAPERERLAAYSRVDAHRLARHTGLDFPAADCQPAPDAVAQANRVLVAATQRGTFAAEACRVSAELWGGRGDVGAGLGAADDASTAQHLAQAGQRRRRLGHYLGATFHYAGEWYWGIDRLRHLEQRLQDLGARRDAGRGDLLFPLEADLTAPARLDHPPAIDFYFSFRSPYSAIVAPRVFELGRLTGAPVRLRFVLPMVMRGLPVPRIKRRYIAQDVAREAWLRGTPFGRINDPVGRPTERGLSLIPLAERQGAGPRYVLSFMRGVWAEGLDAGSDRGLRRIAERAGLSWADALRAIDDPAWREAAEANRRALFALGLWGVPSFALDDLAVWGQDRLWAVQQALLQRRAGLPGA